MAKLPNRSSGSPIAEAVGSFMAVVRHNPAGGIAEPWASTGFALGFMQTIDGFY